MDALLAQEVMEHINNRFVKSEEAGEFAIKDGYLYTDSLADGQWCWIDGSVFNDGLHQFVMPDEAAETGDLTDEVFTGRVQTLVIPRTFEALVDEMEEWVKAHPASSGGYTSESFGGYSYTLATNSDGTPVTWRDYFRQELNRWRKMPGCR